MNRRTFLQAAAVVPVAPALAAEPAHGSMLWDHIVGAIRKADEQRAARLQSLKTPSQIHALQREVRARLAEMWGPFPLEASPLNARRNGTVDRDDYVIEKIIYESRPRFFVTANLYRPKDVSGRMPAVVFPPGHTDNGKAGESYQRFCILMARNGFVVLALDCLSQGERIQFWDKEKRASLFRPGTGEHSILGKQCYLLGINLMQYRVWDTIRGVDYLETRSDVDSTRIGLAGQSGGGMETLQLAPFETRFRAAAAVCAVTTFRHKTEALLTGDPEQNLFGTLGYGIDHPELLAAVAPRPVLIAAAIRDFVPVAGARRTWGEIRPVFKLLGAEDAAGMIETDDQHSLNAEFRRGLTRWFLRWLGNGKPEVAERLTELPPDRDLWCTESGQVAESLGGETVFTLNQHLAARIAPRRAVPQNAGEFEKYRREIEVLAQRIPRLDLRRDEPGVVRPAKFFGAKGETVLLFAEAGKDDAAVQQEIVQPLVAAGYRVAGVDVRGWGETTPVNSAKKNFQWDDFFAFRAMELGQTLFGQRLYDVLRSAEEMVSGGAWTAVGIGAGALLVAHAAVLDLRFRRVALVRPLLSYRSLAGDPQYRQPFSSFLPGVIEAYEVRDLLASIAPRKVVVVNPEDARRGPVDLAAARKEFDWSAQVHRVAQSSGFDLRCGVPGAEIGLEIGRLLRS